MATAQDEKTFEVNQEAATDELSDDDEVEETTEVLSSTNQEGLNGRELIFNHDSFPWLDLSVVEGSTKTYFAEVSEFTKERPDTTLHRGSKGGPTCGLSWLSWGRSFRCGVGPDDLSSTWTQFTRSGFSFKQYFPFEWRGTNYRLARARAAEGKYFLAYFKVVDDATGELLAQGWT